MLGQIENRFKEISDIDADLSIFPLKAADGLQTTANKERSKKRGEVFTPLWLVDKMILKAADGLLSAETTLDLCAGYGQFTIRMLRYLNNSVDNFDAEKWLTRHTFSEIDDRNINMIGYIFGEDSNILTGDSRNLWLNDMQFDLCFSNPPYNKGVDLKIIEAIEPLCKEMVVVHPSTWLLDLKGLYKPYISFKTTIKNKLKSVELFNGNPVFGIKLFVPCVITHLDKNHSDKIDVKYFNDEYVVDNMEDITKFGKDWKPIVKPFMKKMKKYIFKNKNIWDKHIDYKKLDKLNGDYYVQLAQIRGNVKQNNDKNIMAQDDFYSLTMKNMSKNIGIRKTTRTPTYKFNSIKESKIFIKYCQTNFVRFCLSILKDKITLDCGEMELIPWMDFTQEWDDQKLYKFFEIDKKTQSYIENFLPDYYGIRERKNNVAVLLPLIS